MSKKVLVVGIVLLSLLMVGTALAQTPQFTISGLYNMGNGSFKETSETETRDWAVLVNGEASVYKNIMVDASYKTSWAFKVKSGDEFVDINENDEYKQNLILAGAKYRLTVADGMSLSAGAGYLQANTSIKAGGSESALDGWGIYGKVGLDMTLSPQLSIKGDAAYAPIGKFTSGSIEEIEGTVLSAGGAVVYNINESLGVQVGVNYSKITAEKEGAFNGEYSSLVYGAGVVLRF